MPRIDPFQLLKCLSVLLGPTGGIKSKEEVHRLANLMTKFSKKLVSKCIYIQILKTTDTDLLSQFMDAGGWSLIHMWLTDGIVAKNWALIQELLELLLLCPVKIERLKSNNCPKLIKGLSKEVSHQIVRILAGHLVEQWLKIVKGEAAPNSVPAQIIGGLPSEITYNSTGQLEHNHQPTNSTLTTVNDSAITNSINSNPVEQQNYDRSNRDSPNVPTSRQIVPEDVKIPENVQSHPQPSVLPSKTTPIISNSVQVCKITIRDGDQVLAKVETEASNINNAFKTNSEREINGDVGSSGGSREDDYDESVSSEDKDENGATTDEVATIETKQRINEKNEDSTNVGNKTKNEKNVKENIGNDSNKSSDKENRDFPKTDDKKSSSNISGEKKTTGSSSSSHGTSSRSGGSSSSRHGSSSSHKTGSSSHKSSSSSSSHRSSGSKSSSSREKSSRDKERHSNSSGKHVTSSSSSSSVNRNKSEREKEREKEKEKLKKDQAEKDKATLEKVQAQAISSKLGKIPRKKFEDEKFVIDSSVRKSSTDSRESSKENKDKTEGKKISGGNSGSGSGSATTTTMGGLTIEKKQISISIENRKNSQDSSRPKTVKTFNSKFRSTGLEEEVKPAISRVIGAKKTIGSGMEKKIVPTKTLVGVKRSSPLRETSTIADKRAKLCLDQPATSPIDEKKGAIKLIPPKPKPMVLQESDMFMDALTASTKNKEPRKRKRRTSITKDGPTDAKKSDKSDVEGGHDSPQHPSSPQSSDEKSPLALKPNFKFYQDTLETDEDKEEKSDESSNARKDDDSTDRTKEDGDDNEDDEINISNVVKNDIAATMAKNEARQAAEDEAEAANFGAYSPDPDDATSEALDFGKNGRSVSPLPEIRYVDGLRSVLLLQKRKGPKKMLKWKTELESVRYFELDETERVNVTKTFTDMKQMEKQNEREAFQMARKLSTEDLMEEKTRWKPLIPIDLLPALVEPGKDSREKDIQYAREKGILQALYFNRSMIPDSPAEPDDERHHGMTDPKLIPLEDLTGNKESEKDFTGLPWPEPKVNLTPPHPPPMQQSGYHYPTAFGHNPPTMLPPPITGHVTMSSLPPMGPPVGMQMGPGGLNPIGQDMITSIPVPTSVGAGGWRTGDGKVVVPDVSMVPMPQQSMPPPGYPPPGMEHPLGPPGMMGPPPPLYNQQDNFGIMGPEDMGYGNYPGPPGPGMYGPPGPGFGPNGPPPPPPRGGGPMHGGGGPNRGRANGPGWFRGGGGPMRAGGGGGGWRGGGWRGNGKQPPICRQFTKNGYCRGGDKCQYLHPGVNCPPF